MRKIWKYSLEAQECVLSIPKGGKVVHLALQAHGPQLWILVDPEAEKEPRKFITYGTGHPISDNHVYVGTYQQPPFVWHVFEEVD